MIKSIGSTLHFSEVEKKPDVYSLYKNMQKITAKKSTLEIKRESVLTKLSEVDSELDTVKSSIAHVLCNTLYLRGDSVVELVREVLGKLGVSAEKYSEIEDSLFKSIKKHLVLPKDANNLTEMWGEVTSTDGLLLYPDVKTCELNGVSSPVKVLVDLSTGVISGE